MKERKTLDEPGEFCYNYDILNACLIVIIYGVEAFFMNYEKEIVFSYLEEDNTQRAYFRIKPLLSVSGDMREEASRLWPDEGALRIVPDKNEQFYFKDRMRTLGSFCIMDLTPFSPDANKIRTNKNYRPERDERNQFILYSDTVKPLPENTFFEVLPGSPEAFETLSASAVTPLFYLRFNDELFGPVTKSAPAKPEHAVHAEGTLYQLPCPDGKVRSIFCAAAQQKAAAPAHKPEELPLGRPLQILDDAKGFEETLKDIAQPLPLDANLLKQKPAEEAPAIPRSVLTGTPLYRSGAARAILPRPKNQLQEVVANQWRAARNDPPAAPLPSDATLRPVENPVEMACQHLKAAWQVPETQAQLVDCILSLPDITARLEPRLAADSGATTLQKVLLNRLQDLEAERLSALVQLDKARNDVEQFRKTSLSSLRASDQAELDRLSKAKEEHESALGALKEQLTALTSQRDALQAQVDALRGDVLPETLARALAQAQMVAPVSGVPLRLSGVPGNDVSVEEIIRRLTDVCTQSHVPCSRNVAVAMLALLAVCPRVGVVCPTPAPLVTLCRNAAARMGWQSGYGEQVSAEQKVIVSPLSADSTPLMLLTTLPDYLPTEHAAKLLLSHDAASMTHSSAYELDPWPILSIPTLPMLEASTEKSPAEKVSRASLAAVASGEGGTKDEIAEVLKPVLACVPPLSGKAWEEMSRFAACCAAWMDGGLAASIDWAIMLWIIPAVDRAGRGAAALKSHLDEFPRSLSALSQA